MNKKPLLLFLAAAVVVVIIGIVVSNETGLSDGNQAASTNDVVATVTTSSPAATTTSSSPASTAPTTTTSQPVATTTTPTTAPPPATTQAPPPPPANTVDSIGLTYCGWQDTPSGTLIATGNGSSPLWQPPGSPTDKPAGDPGLQIGETYHFVRSGSNTNIVVGTDRIANGAGEACPFYFATAEWHNG